MHDGYETADVYDVLWQRQNWTTISHICNLTHLSHDIVVDQLSAMTQLGIIEENQDFHTYRVCLLE